MPHHTEGKFLRVVVEGTFSFLHLRRSMSGEKEDLETTKVVTKLLRTLAKIEALEKQDAALLPPRFVGANQDFAFESDLHYGTYSGLRYGYISNTSFP